METKAEILSITGRKSDNVIGVGPFLGAFAHVFLRYYPMITRIRQENPDAVIICGGEIGNWWYFRNLVDYYIGLTTNQQMTLSVGWNEDVWNKMDNPYYADENFRNLIIKQVGSCNRYFTTQLSPVEMEEVYRENCCSIAPIGSELGIPYNPNSKAIGISCRKKPDSRGETNAYETHFNYTLSYLVDKGYTPIVYGMRGVSCEPKIDGCVNLVNEDEKFRAEKTTKSLLRCRFILGYATSATDYAMSLGLPILVFDCNPRQECIYRVHTNLFYSLMDVFNPQEWKDPLNWKELAPGTYLPYEYYKDRWESAIEDFADRCLKSDKIRLTEKSRKQGIFSYKEIDWPNIVHLVRDRKNADWPKIF